MIMRERGEVFVTEMTNIQAELLEKHRRCTKGEEIYSPHTQTQNLNWSVHGGAQGATG